MIIDTKKIKNKLDIRDWKIEIFIFGKFCELFNIYITFKYFSILKISFSPSIKIIITILFILLLSLLEIHSSKAMIFIFFYSYSFIFTFYYSLRYVFACIKYGFIIIAIIVAAIIALLITRFITKSTEGIYDYKGFFESDFGIDNKDSYIILNIIIGIVLLTLFAVIYIFPALSEIKKNIVAILPGLISSGLIGNLIPFIFKGLNHSYRSISTMNENGVVIRNLLKLDSSKFYLWFNNDQNSPTQVRYVGWCFGSSIKKINHYQWKISNMHYYTPIITNISNILEYDPFENVTNFGKSAILTFKLDNKLKNHIVKDNDCICIIYMDSIGNFYAKKLFFNSIKDKKSKNILINKIYAIKNNISLTFIDKEPKHISYIKKLKLIIKNKFHK